MKSLSHLRPKQLIIRSFIIIILLGVLSILVVTIWPGVGARIAKPLRGVIGNERVAQLETILFTIQDTVKQGSYNVGLAEPAAPWQVVEASPPPSPSATRPFMTATPSPEPTTSTGQAGADNTPAPSATPANTPTPSPSATPTAVPWSLLPLEAFTDLEGEGIWQPYLYNEAGEVVGLRTFLLPDPERPYATVAIIAFDLTKIDLNYVLGVDEPKLPGGPGGDGRIPEADRQAHHLLAAFNGGFMATHGEYGAMSNGIVALPAKSNYGTVAIYDSGEIKIGEWGTDIQPDDTFIAWRQNARMVVHNGQINDRVYNGSIVTWGGNINGNIVTWRSGIGLSQDQQVLYYFAGPSVNMPSLAEAMMAARAYNGILLDINASWVHFTAFRANNTETDPLTAEPLFEEGMETHPDRYLQQSSRDFFYITTK